MPHAVGLDRLVTLIAVTISRPCRTAFKSGFAMVGPSGFFMRCLFVFAQRVACSGQDVAVLVKMWGRSSAVERCALTCFAADLCLVFSEDTSGAVIHDGCGAQRIEAIDRRKCRFRRNFGWRTPQRYTRANHKAINSWARSFTVCPASCFTTKSFVDV